jgi:hypothetical protein
MNKRLRFVFLGIGLLLIFVAIGYAKDPRVINLAQKYGTATANAVYTGQASTGPFSPPWTPDRAIDGDNSTLWNAGKYGDPGRPCWLIVNLNRAFRVEAIVLKTAQGVNPGQYEKYNLYVSMDGTNWKGIISRTLLDDATHYRHTVRLPSSTQLQYVKFEVVGGTHWAHLNEMEIYGEP